MKKQKKKKELVKKRRKMMRSHKALVPFTLCSMKMENQIISGCQWEGTMLDTSTGDHSKGLVIMTSCMRPRILFRFQSWEAEMFQYTQ